MKVTANRWDSSGICRISDDRSMWRVVVETWPERDGFHGRFVFVPDRSPVPADPREGPDALRGRTREEIVAQAYALSEDRLRQLFRSLA
ncbi:MAG: hypothetical protein ACT443_06320 [Gemmatimonadota bacterium]